MRPAASIPLLLATILGAPADAQCPVAKLEPSKGAGAPITYGMCCAISDQFALVGAPYIPGRVFVYDTSTWQELFTRKSPIKKHTAFGYSVAIDGVLGVVGAPQDDSQGKDAGAAFVYDLQAKQLLFQLHADHPEDDDWFGASVDLDGSLLVVGARGDDTNGAIAGAVYVFDLSTGGTQVHKLIGSTPALAWLGYDVAIAGGRVLAGAPEYFGPGPGIAYLFDVATGQQLHELHPSDGDTHGHFGWSVALTEEYAVVGAPGHTHTNERGSGAVYFYDVASGTEVHEERGPTYEALGRDVAFMRPDLVVATGAEMARALEVPSGTVVFGIDSPVGPGGQFGSSVAAFGAAILLGAEAEKNLEGSAYVFEPPGAMGESYCGPANLNSAGVSASMGSVGSPSTDCNRVSMIAHDLPVGNCGIFIASKVQAFVPFPMGSQGNLCLGGTIGGFSKQVQEVGLGGSFSIDVDLTALPPPLPPAVLPGETWYFQAWFRDKNPGPTSNFTDGLSVTFR